MDGSGSEGLREALFENSIVLPRGHILADDLEPLEVQKVRTARLWKIDIIP